MKRLLSAIARWFATSFPTDEQMAAPLNDADVRARMRDLEVCREVAIRRCAELHTTRSPLARNR
jgi:hypothetical protein